MTPRRSVKPKLVFERLTSWVGSPVSFVVHTVVFLTAFALPLLSIATWSTMLLVLTTVVSLEAIYLSIFIQMAVNQQTRELAELSEDVDEIQEDIEEISEDEDRDEAVERSLHERQIVTLEQLTTDIKRLLADVTALKERSR